MNGDPTFNLRSFRRVRIHAHLHIYVTTNKKRRGRSLAKKVLDLNRNKEVYDRHR